MEDDKVGFFSVFSGICGVSRLAELVNVVIGEP